MLNHSLNFAQCVLLYVKKELKVERISGAGETNDEYNLVAVVINEDILLIAVYAPPGMRNRETERISEEIEKILSNNECSYVMIVGDFNKNTRLCATVESFGLDQKVGFNTRKDSVLDLIFASEDLCEKIAPRDIIPRCDHTQLYIELRVNEIHQGTDTSDAMIRRWMDRMELKRKLAEIDVALLENVPIEVVLREVFDRHSRLESECTRLEVKYPSIKVQIERHEKQQHQAIQIPTR
ncbi:hypothetical protein Ciccas_006024, partial [Cichlidogyrus casuarinus]